MDSLWAKYGWLFTTVHGVGVLLASFIFILLVRAIARKYIKEEPEKNPSNFLNLEFLSEIPEAKGKDRPTDLVETPPFPREIQAIPIIEIIRQYKVPIDRLVRESALAEEEANAYLLPAVEKLAGIVHLLPASQEDHHSYEGGLFTHSLETATNAVVAAQNQIFDADETPRQKYQNKKRWVLAAALAGLAHDLGKVIQDIRVVDADTHKIRRMDVPMKNWIDVDKVRAYSISWSGDQRVPKSHQGDSHFMLRSILSDSIVHFLCYEGNPKIYKALRNAVYDMSSGPLGKILQDADIRSASDDQAHRAQLSANNQIIQTSNARQICRAIQRLLTSGKWSYNKADSKVFITREGCFLRWDDESVATDISTASRQLASETKTSYVPRSKQIMFESLQHGRVLLEKPKVGGYFWSVCPITAKNTYISCLRFLNPQHLFGFDVVPTTIDAHIFGTVANLRQKSAWLAEYDEVPESFNSSKEDLIDGEKPEAVIERAMGVMKLTNRGKAFEEVLEVLARYAITKPKPMKAKALTSGMKEDTKPINEPQNSTGTADVETNQKRDGKNPSQKRRKQTPSAISVENIEEHEALEETILTPVPKEEEISEEESEVEEDIIEEPNPLGSEENAYAEFAKENGETDDFCEIEEPNEDVVTRARNRILASASGFQREETKKTEKQSLKEDDSKKAEISRREIVQKKAEKKSHDYKDYLKLIEELERNVKQKSGAFFKPEDFREGEKGIEVSLANFYRIADKRGFNRAVLEQVLKNSQLEISHSRQVILCKA